MLACRLETDALVYKDRITEAQLKWPARGETTSKLGPRANPEGGEGVGEGKERGKSPVA